tara:strand:+ start:4991 stop:5356 length:366 start_codon:yes stop_codon:yes gene_type:complete
MSQQHCVPLCDADGNYNYQYLTKPVNKHDPNAKGFKSHEVYNNLKQKYQKSSSNNLNNKIGLMVFYNQANKVYEKNAVSCIDNTKKDTSKVGVKHNSYHRYLAKKRGETLHKELCKKIIEN